MRKKVTALILAAVITVAVSVPAWACTPPLGVGNIWGDLTPPDEIESETEIEAETETAAETEAETVTPGKHYLDWSKYIPESFRNRWMSFVRR